MERDRRYNGDFFSFELEKTPADEICEFSFHSHSRYEIYHFTGGSGAYCIEGNEYPLEKNAVLIMRSAEMHRPRLAADADYERTTIHFAPQFLQEIDPQQRLLEPFLDHPAGIGNMYTRKDMSSNIIYDCLSALQALGDDEYMNALRTKNLIYCILQELHDAHLRRKSEHLREKKNSISPIIHYIEEHIGELVSLAQIQDEFYISKTHLTRIFKEATGLSAWEYICIKRLTIARGLLRDGMRASVVAEKCGFNDYSAFYRAYKKRFGVAPTNKI